MLRVLLVDHALHRTTASSDFFLALLKTRFDVSCLHLVPQRHGAIDWDHVAAFDIIVVWQLDFLAPLFLARGHRTVVVPMYDGSAILPQVHWAAATGARFINFSRSLHERVRLLGLDSLLVKYFPEPVAEKQLPRFDGLRAFLWQRRPQDGITADLVGRLFGEQLELLHVHNVPDDPSLAGHLTPPARIGDAPVTVSEWFADRSDYYRVLEACNVFICPRPSEGIGMAMLEAMARGLLVLGNDLPSHNEYICNWVNGVLFNAANPGWADFSAVAPIARMGWRTAQEGHVRWLASADAVLSFIEGTPRYRPAEPRLVAQIQRDLVSAYLAGGEIYERSLVKLLPLLASRQIATEGDAVSAMGTTIRGRKVLAERRKLPVAVVPRKTDDSATIALTFANGAARPLLAGGWSVDEAFGVWIEGVQADLKFAAAIEFPVAALRLRVLALAPGEELQRTCLGITVNGVACPRSISVAGGGPRELQCDIVPPRPLTAQTWHVEFVCDRTFTAYGDSRSLSLAIIALSIDFLPTVEAPAIEAMALPETAYRGASPREAAAAALDAVIRKASRRNKAHATAAAISGKHSNGRVTRAPERVDGRVKV